MKCKVIGRVFGANGAVIPVGTEVERKSADGVIYEEVKASKPEPKEEKTLEVATPKRGPKRRTKSDSDE